MRKVKFLALVVLTFLSFQLNAQDQDKDLIKKTIEMYLEGWMTGDTTKLGKAMHSTCKLKNIKDEAVTVMDRDNYLSRFKPRTRPANTSGRVVSIDITNNIAAAKCEIETAERIFTDYFNMVKLNGEWYIADKVSTNAPKAK